MAITINSNVSAFNVLRQLGDATSSLQTSFEHLSSGLRINRASDDPAGLSIASGLNIDNRVYTQAVRNGNDAVSLLNIAEGATTELSTILVRLKELAQQSANDTLSLAQRKALDGEGVSLVNEFNRIAASTRFNNLNLLEAGSAATGIQVGYGTNGSIQLQVGDYLEHASGTGSFTPFGSAGATTGGDISVITADFNNDGVLDIAQATNGGTDATVLLGNGDGTFSTAPFPAAEPNGDPIVALATGDFNGDGVADIAMTSSTGYLTIQTGDGTGGFAVQSNTFIGLANLSDIAVGDFDNNGTADLAIASDGGGSAYTVTGDGAGNVSSVQNNVAIASVGDSIQFGDFNGDGNLDFAVASSGANLTGTVFIGDGAGNFSASALNAGNKGGRIAVGDINNDGYDDIIGTTNSGNLDIHLSDGDGTFTDQLQAATGGFQSYHLTLSDGNNDGLLDIMLVGSAGIKVATGNGDGSFNLTPIVTVPVSLPTNGVFGDFNGDGVLDAISANAATVPMVLLATTVKSNTLPRLYLLDREGALDAFGIIDRAMTRVSAELGSIGATMSRLSSALNTLQVTRDNLASAESQIRDADVAQDAADLVRKQIVQQAAIGILGQANQIPALALDLLKAPNS